MSVFHEIFEVCQNKHNLYSKFNDENIRNLTGLTGFDLLNFKKSLLATHSEEHLYGISENGINNIIISFFKKYKSKK